VIMESPDRKNISLIRLRIPKDDQRRFQIVARQIRELRDGKAIIFVPTVKVGHQVREGLAAQGIRLEFYYANAGDPAWRDQVQARFTGRLEPAINAIIATSAFGMGIDIPNVRVVIHWQHPFSVEEYLQGFGRAGRDGRPSLAVLFVDPHDRDLLRFMVTKNVPPELQAEREQEMDVIYGMAQALSSCFRKQLMSYLSAGTESKKSISIRLLEWAFGERSRTTSATACCDTCSPELARRLLQFRA
jgi:ATP-dependent DNA helicase RecQ